MTDQAASASKLEARVSQLRCIGCGAVRESEATNVRCAQCGDLLEVVYPGWETSAGMRAAGPDASRVQVLLRHGLAVFVRAVRAGAGPFREVLPALRGCNHVITLRE